MFSKLLINNLKIALFFPPNTTFKSINVANAVNEEFGDIFSEDPNIFNLPPSAPTEIPRIIYNQNQKDNAQLSIGFSRADLSVGLKSQEDWKCRIIQLSLKLQKLFIEKLKMRIIRVGMIATYTIDTDTSLDDFLAQYIKSDRLADVAEYNMSWLKKADLNGVKTNKWVRLFLSEQPIESRKLVIDINTIAEQTLDLQHLPLNDLIEQLLGCLEGEVFDVI